MEQGQKAILTLSIGCLAITSLIVESTPPATGFENSVYRAYPTFMWLVYSFGLLAAFFGLYRARKRESVISFLGSIFAYYTLVAILPIARGYRLHTRGTSDTLVHLGEVKSVLETGHMPSHLFYPAIHSTTTILSFFTTPERAAIVVPLSATIALLLFIALAIISLTNTDCLALCLFAALPLTLTHFHVHLHPAFVSTLGLPVLVYLMTTGSRIPPQRARVMMLVTLIWMVFAHPFTAVFGTIVIASSISVIKMTRNVGFVTNVPNLPSTTTVLLIVGGLWIMWYTAQDIFGTFIGQVLESAVDGAGGPGTQTAGQAAETSSQTNSSLAFLIRWGGLLYGASILPLAAGIGVIAYRLSDFVRRREKIHWGWIYTAAQLGIGIGLAASFLIAYLGPTNPVRAARYGVILGTISIGLGLVHYTDSELRWQNVLAMTLVICVLATAIIGVFSVHQTNKHMTEMEYTGVEHTLSHQNEQRTIRSYDISSKTQRYVVGTHNINSSFAMQTDNPKYEIPENMGYHAQDTAGGAMGDSYLITKEYDLKRPEAEIFEDHQRPGLHVYDRNDIERLGTDQTAQKVYNNGEFDLWVLDDP